MSAGGVERVKNPRLNTQRSNGRYMICFRSLVAVAIMVTGGCEPEATETPEDMSPGPCASAGEENVLLSNPSAEADMKDWETDWFTAAAEVFPCEGERHFYAQSSIDATMRQVVSLEAAGITADQIDAGDLLMVGGGFQSDWDGGEDYGRIFLTALDESGEVLNVVVGPAAGADDWQRVDAVGALPPGTRRIEFRFTAFKFDGSDNDGYLDAAFLWIDRDLDHDGSGVLSGDCDDENEERGRHQIEVCDEVDNDCDGEIDEDALVYLDADLDHYGRPDAGAACGTVGLYVRNNLDCDDADPAINPDAEVVDECDHIDRNCDQRITDPCNILENPSAEAGITGWSGDPEWVANLMQTPVDGAVHFYAGATSEAILSQEVNLLDAGFSVEQLDGGRLILYGGGHVQSYNNLLNENDVGEIRIVVLDAARTPLLELEGDTSESRSWVLIWRDAPLPIGARFVEYSFTATRLAGESNGAYLDAAFLWVDEDEDQDGYGSTVGDCDDAHPEVAPGMPETCDQLDNDCDGETDEDLELWYQDRDGDGAGDASSASCEAGDSAVLLGGDCNDADPLTYPDSTMAECDHVDHNCDGVVAEDCNLLVNAGAEEGVEGWEFDPVFSAGAQLPAYEGAYHFFAGAVEQAALWQVVDLVASGWSTADLDSGSLMLLAGGYQRSYVQAGIQDTGQLEITVQDGAEQVLEEVAGPVVEEVAEWTLTELQVPLPAGARTVTLRFTAIRNSGENNDGYLDSAFVILTRSE